MFRCFEAEFFKIDESKGTKFIVLATDWPQANEVAQKWLAAKDRWLTYAGYKLVLITEIPEEQS